MARVLVTDVLHAPLERVWQAIRDFNGLPSWHPFVESSHIEDGRSADTVGCVRNFQLAGGGGTIREQLLALSDLDHVCSYSILESPMPVSNYVATLRLLPITTSGLTLGQWSVEFDVPPDVEQQTVEQVTAIFQEGFASLNRVLAGGTR